MKKRTMPHIMGKCPVDIIRRGRQYHVVEFTSGKGLGVYPSFPDARRAALTLATKVPA